MIYEYELEDDVKNLGIYLCEITELKYIREAYLSPDMINIDDIEDIEKFTYEKLKELSDFNFSIRILSKLIKKSVHKTHPELDDQGFSVYGTSIRFGKPIYSETTPGMEDRIDY